MTWGQQHNTYEAKFKIRFCILLGWRLDREALISVSLNHMWNSEQSAALSTQSPQRFNDLAIAAEGRRPLKMPTSLRRKLARSFDAKWLVLGIDYHRSCSLLIRNCRHYCPNGWLREGNYADDDRVGFPWD